MARMTRIGSRDSEPLSVESVNPWLSLPLRCRCRDTIEVETNDQIAFWNLIETAGKRSRRRYRLEQARILTNRLTKLSAEEIVQFQRLLDEQMALTYRWDLRGAGTSSTGGVSDKGFESFLRVAHRPWQGHL